MIPKALALMGTASFCGGVHHKKHSEQQEIATRNSQKNSSTSPQEAQILVELLAEITRPSK
jgi:hypothetical protein